MGAPTPAVLTRSGRARAFLHRHQVATWFVVFMLFVSFVLWRQSGSNAQSQRTSATAQEAADTAKAATAALARETRARDAKICSALKTDVVGLVQYIKDHSMDSAGAKALYDESTRRHRSLCPDPTEPHP